MNSRILITAVMALSMVGLACAAEQTSEQTDVMATVHQFVNGFNKGDTKSALAACADQTSIIDEFPPHAWSGAGGCSKWLNDYQTWAKKSGVSEGHVRLAAARHIDITGDRAYVVVPSAFSFKQNGKPVNEMGSTFTLVLQKSGAGWRIVAWTWTKQ